MRLRLIIALLLIFTNCPVLADTAKIEWIHYEDEYKANQALKINDDIVAIASNNAYFFKEGFKNAKFRTPISLEGYITHIKNINDDLFVTGIIKRKNSIFNSFSKDNRQAAIAILKLNGPSFDVEEIKDISGRVIFDLMVNKNDIITLSGSRAGYKLTKYNKNLRKILETVEFGYGGNGSFAITPQNEIWITGYNGDNNVFPTIWIFDQNFKLLKEFRLSENYKSAGNGLNISKTFYDDGLVYSFVGHENYSDKADVLIIKAFNVKFNEIWSKQTPYINGLEVFQKSNGQPIIILPRDKKLEVWSINQKGDFFKQSFSRPSEPKNCFFEGRYYHLVNFISENDASGYIVISGSPISHPTAGCAAVGKLYLK
jgi:hypothetical protein